MSRRKSNPAPQAPAAKQLWSKRLLSLERRLKTMVAAVREIVEIESPSDDKSAADRMGAHLAEKFAAMGGVITRHKARDRGDHLQVNFAGRDRRKPVLLLGHFDTVYPLGTPATMPCSEANGKLMGPGVLDMKAGIVLMMFAIEALQEWHGELPRPVTVLLVSDEEVGSNSSRKITEALARQSAGVLVLEPSYGPKGAVKTARKGVGEYALRVRGVASHAGLDPARGHSAIVELARQIDVVRKLTDLTRGISVNVGVIRGGTRTNVIAAEAVAEIDVRIASAGQAKALDRSLRALRPFDKHCKIEITGGINRMPMERSTSVVALFEKARQISKQVGWKLTEAAVGGGSDGNFTAGIGIPTLDGLGAVGDGAHATHEFIYTSELPRRALLLAGMIEAV